MPRQWILAEERTPCREIVVSWVVLPSVVPAGNVAVPVAAEAVDVVTGYDCYYRLVVGDDGFGHLRLCHSDPNGGSASIPDDQCRRCNRC